MMNRIRIFDTTLRDGEQSPGVNLNAQEKLEIARHLALLGVDVIEAGFPIASPGDFEAVRLIAKEIKGPTIAALARAVEQDIVRAAEAVEQAEKPRIHTFIATSPIHMKYKLRKEPDEVLEMAINACRTAKKYVDDVEFSRRMPPAATGTSCAGSSRRPSKRRDDHQCPRHRRATPRPTNLPG